MGSERSEKEAAMTSDASNVVRHVMVIQAPTCHSLCFRKRRKLRSPGVFCPSQNTDVNQVLKEPGWHPGKPGLRNSSFLYLYGFPRKCFGLTVSKSSSTCVPGVHACVLLGHCETCRQWHPWWCFKRRVFAKTFPKGPLEVAPFLLENLEQWCPIRATILHVFLGVPLLFRRSTSSTEDRQSFINSNQVCQSRELDSTDPEGHKGLHGDELQRLNCNQPGLLSQMSINLHQNFKRSKFRKPQTRSL